MTKNKYFDFVFLSSEEYKKLVDKFGEKDTNEKMENLNNYIGARGFQKKYKSHYHVILTWQNKTEKDRQKKEFISNLPQEKPVQPREKKVDSPEITAIKNEYFAESQRINTGKLWKNPEERAKLKKISIKLNQAINDARPVMATISTNVSCQMKLGI
jgi:hypothetical protein|tara:strand:+ start:4373 stop:4843 length:471 start_codon:yes stop_codon:yes gene_type:complete